MLNKETWTHKKLLLQPLRFSWKEAPEVLKGDHRDFQIHFPLQHTHRTRGLFQEEKGVVTERSPLQRRHLGSLGRGFGPKGLHLEQLGVVELVMEMQISAAWFGSPASQQFQVSWTEHHT